MLNEEMISRGKENIHIASSMLLFRLFIKRLVYVLHRWIMLSLDVSTHLGPATFVVVAVSDSVVWNINSILYYLIRIFLFVFSWQNKAITGWGHISGTGKLLRNTC